MSEEKFEYQGTARWVNDLEGTITIRFGIESDQGASTRQLKQIASEFRAHVEERIHSRTMRTGVAPGIVLDVNDVELEIEE